MSRSQTSLVLGVVMIAFASPALGQVMTADTSTPQIDVAPSVFSLHDIPMLLVSEAALTFPPEALFLTSNAQVVLRYVVQPDGTPTNITVVRSLGPAFDDAAKALIENMVFHPMLNEQGEPVAQPFFTPVSFNRPAEALQ